MSHLPLNLNLKILNVSFDLQNRSSTITITITISCSILQFLILFGSCALLVSPPTYPTCLGLNALLFFELIMNLFIR
jgi:hypothetical protein